MIGRAKLAGEGRLMDKQSISKRAFSIAVVLALSGCASSCETPPLTIPLSPGGTCPEGYGPGTFTGPGSDWGTGFPDSRPQDLSCCYWQGGGTVTILWQNDLRASGAKDGELVHPSPADPNNPGCSVAYAICSLDGTNCLGVPTPTPGVGQPLP